MIISLHKLAPKPGTFTVFDFHWMDVPQIGYELTRIPDHRLVLVLRAPHPFYILPSFLMHMEDVHLMHPFWYVFLINKTLIGC